MTEPDPIHILTEQELDPSHDFLGKVRRKIERRSATAQVATFSWRLPRIVLIEFLHVLGDIPIQFSKKKDPGQ